MTLTGISAISSSEESNYCAASTVSFISVFFRGLPGDGPFTSPSGPGSARVPGALHAGLGMGAIPSAEVLVHPVTVRAQLAAAAVA